MIAGLPYDAEVEYLQSTGAQYIDTGVSACNAVVGTDIRFQSTSTQNSKWVFGTYNNSLGNGYNYLVGSFSGWCVGLYDDMFYRPGTPVDTGVHRVRINIDGKTRFDDVVLLDGIASKTYEGDINTSLWMFMTHRNGSNPMNGYYLTAKVFYCKVYLNGVLVRDFIPVRFTNELGQSEGAMYDRVSRKLFRNAGTGSFTVGPDVATPVMGLHFMKSPAKTARDYVQDGLIAMWDGIENAGWGVHDAAATTWKDLVGGVEAYASASGAKFSFAQNVCQCDLSSVGNGVGVLVAYLLGDVGLSVRQIDAVYSSSVDYSAPLCLSGVSSRQFVCANADGLVAQVGYSQFGATNLSATQLHAYSAILTGGWPIMSAAYSDGQSLDISGYKTAITQYQPYSQGRIFLGYKNSEGGVLDLADVRLYSRALTAAEIAANYAVDKERFNLP